MVLEHAYHLAHKDSCKAGTTKDIFDRRVGNFEFCKKVQDFGTFLQRGNMDVNPNFSLGTSRLSLM